MIEIKLVFDNRINLKISNANIILKFDEITDLGEEKPHSFKFSYENIEFSQDKTIKLHLEHQVNKIFQTKTC